MRAFSHASGSGEDWGKTGLDSARRAAVRHALITVLLVAVPGLLQAASVTFQAESGGLGANFTNGTDGAVQYVSISTDRINTGNPGSSNRVATYAITFPAAGTYQLYARLRVGPDLANDDSLFYASSFGPKSPTTDADWVMVNGIGNLGYSNSADIVAGGGTVGNGVWKWINLSQFTGRPGLTVSTGSLTQTFQIGARENGLHLDKFLFGTAGYTFPVAALDAGGPGSLPSATIDTTKLYQTIEGLGGATAFYAGWITAHPYKQEIYSNAFAGLHLSMLRLGNWYRYQSSISTFDFAAAEIVANANRVLGRPVPVYMSSWAPPAFLKSNGQVANGGTLVYTNGGFAYTNFAQYWFDSVRAYKSNGVELTWISIQNEPDWVADYDSCIFHPTEDTVNGTNYASYAKALDAVYQRLTNLPSPPKILAPEVVHIAYNDLRNYAATMNSNSFYGVAYHLYGDSTDGTADGFLGNVGSATNVFPNKPHFMTEFGMTGMIDTACLIHNCLTVGQDSGFNYWSLVWPGTDGGLVQIENPWNQSSWTNAPPGTATQSHGWWLAPAYWAMKHYSYFIEPGYRRASATDNDDNVRTSAFLSPDGLRLVVVLINTNSSASAVMNLNFGAFNGRSAVYQTAGTNYFFQSLGSAANPQTFPPQSLTTVVLDKIIVMGAASNPSPANRAAGVAMSSSLGWTPGSNAVTHAVYFGLSSNAVAQATPASPEFKGILAQSAFNPALNGGMTYYWRVDGIAGANTNTGPVWTFVTAPLPALVHRYSFGEAGGTNVADSVAGPAWSGTLPAGGSLAGGQLMLAAASQQYVRLPEGIVSTLTNITIETWVRLNSTTNWSRIFDFGSGSTTNLFLTPQNGGSARLRFAITTNAAGGEQQINGAAALSAGVWYHVVVTLNGNTGILYVNSAAVGTNSNVTVKPASLGSSANNYLGKSQYSDPYFNGLMDEFRIYSVALSPAEIAATYTLGPNQVLSTNGPMVNVTMTPATLTLGWPLAAAGFTVQMRTNLVLGNWANVTSPVPQIVSGQWRVTLPVATNAPLRIYRLAK